MKVLDLKKDLFLKPTQIILTLSLQGKVSLYISGQSYKQFTLIIYDSRVVIWGIFKSGTTLEL